MNYSEKSKSNFDVSQKQVILIKSFSLMNDYLNLIRLHQSVKNFFLFVPAFFGGVFFKLENIQNISIGFFAFSFVASAIYILNDYRDIEKDRLHPEKKDRPLASGAIEVKQAVICFTIFLIAGLIIAFIFKYLLLLHYLVLFYNEHCIYL